MMRFESVCLCAAILAVCGCDKKSEPAPGEGAGRAAAEGERGAGAAERPIKALAADDVIVAVNGVAFTRKDYDDMLASSEYVLGIYNPRASAVTRQRHRQQRERELVNEFTTRQLILQEARRRGLKATPESLASSRELLEKIARKEGLKLAELPTSQKANVKVVYETLEDQALIQTLREAEFGDKLIVTEEDMAAARERFRRYNQMCEQTNALVKARGQAIVERLRKGEDFQQVALETSEEKRDLNGVWGSFVRGEIEDALVRNAAFTLPVGKVSEPFDTADGLVIIKVLERSGVDSPVAAADATVKLGRILLRLGDTLDIPDDKRLRRELEQARLAKVQRPWLAELKQKARVEYPHGTNFWATVKNR